MKLFLLLLTLILITSFVSSIYIIDETTAGIIETTTDDMSVVIKPLVMTLKRLCRILCKEHSDNIYLLMDYHCTGCGSFRYRYI